MTEIIEKTKCIFCKKELVHIEDIESGDTWFKDDKNYYNPGIGLSFEGCDEEEEKKIQNCWFCSEECYDKWVVKKLLEVQNPFTEETCSEETKQKIRDTIASKRGC